MSRARTAALKTMSLVAEAEELNRRANDEIERLRVHLLEFRVREFERQLIMGRIRRAAGTESASPLVTAPAQPAAVTLAGRQLSDEWAEISSTIH